MAMQPFTWGRGGQAKGADDIDRERRIANSLYAQGVDTSPVQHWTQGLARLAMAGAGRIREGRADTLAGERAQADQGLLSGLFSGIKDSDGNSVQIAPGILNALSDPSASDATRGIAQALAQQQITPLDPMKQLQREKLGLEIERMKNPEPNLVNAGGGYLYDPINQRWISAPNAGYQAPSEMDRRIAALMERGLSRQQAENIAYGFEQVVTDPMLKTPMIVDKTTGSARPISPDFSDDPGMGGGEAPQPPRISLYDLADVATGGVPAVQEKWTEIAPQFGLPGVNGTVESRQVLNAASRDMIRALSINPRFPVAEMQAIEKEINIKPSIMTSPDALRERMKAVDTVLRRRLDNERRTATNPNLPSDTRANALQAANDIQNFLGVLGVPKGGTPQNRQHQPSSDGFVDVGNGIRIREIK